MENLRIVLWAGFAMLLYATYAQWSYEPANQQATNQEQQANKNNAFTTTQATQQTNNNAIPPNTGGVLGLSDAIPTINKNNPVEDTVSPALRTDVIRNNVLELYINPNKGADIVGAKLLTYHPTKKETDTPIELLSLNKESYHYFQTGLISVFGGDEANHTKPYRKLSSSGPRETTTNIKYAYEFGGGMSVIKSYTLEKDSFNIRLKYEIINNSGAPYDFVQYVQLVKRNAEVERSMFDVETYSFDGGIVYNGDSYEKLDADDLSDSPYNQTHNSGWAANIKHHFLVALIPPASEPFRFEATHKKDSRLSKISAISLETQSLLPGLRTIVETQLFIGPKLQGELKKTREGLELSVDYGMLAFLAAPLFWLLDNIHKYVGNWGLSIILVTLLIKIVFFRLTENSGKSMAKMKELAPRIKAIQDRYKDDKQAQSKATMELYQREKVNPLAGCLPMLIQIPFFIAFYWVLLESVEIRQAPFFLWIDDLSSRDPYFILPIMMGLGMWFQQKLNPAPPDPTQAKVMAILPFMFTGMFAWFPAGLVLYWLSNSLLSIAQQWRINKKLGTKAPASTGGGGGK